MPMSPSRQPNMRMCTDDLAASTSARMRGKKLAPLDPRLDRRRRRPGERERGVARATSPVRRTPRSPPRRRPPSPRRAAGGQRGRRDGEHPPVRGDEQRRRRRNDRERGAAAHQLSPSSSLQVTMTRPPARAPPSSVPRALALEQHPERRDVGLRAVGRDRGSGTRGLGSAFAWSASALAFSVSLPASAAACSASSTSCSAWAAACSRSEVLLGRGEVPLRHAQLLRELLCTGGRSDHDRSGPDALVGLRLQLLDVLLRGVELLVDAIELLVRLGELLLRAVQLLLRAVEVGPERQRPDQQASGGDRQQALSQIQGLRDFAGSASADASSAGLVSTWRHRRRGRRARQRPRVSSCRVRTRLRRRPGRGRAPGCRCRRRA